jgi:dolichyl-diphosphooligosaccharide--protein glycosyltransferase
LNKPEARRAVYEKSRRFRLLIVAALLFVAYALGCYLRSLPQFSEQHVLTGDDPYVFLRYAEALLKNGSIPSNDTLRYYPQGFDTKYELLLVLWFIAGFSWLTGSQPIDVAIWLPVFFAPLIVIPIFFFTRTLTRSTTAGVIAAFLSATAPAFIIRSFEGFCDKEVFVTPLMFAGLALALSSFNVVTTQGRRRDLITSVALAIASGALIGVAALGWGGFLFTFLVLTAYALLVTLFGKDGKKLSLISIPYLIVLIMSSAFAAFFTIRYGGLDLFKSITFLVPVGMTVPLVVLSKAKKKYVVVIIAILAVLLLYAERDYVLSMVNWFLGNKGLVRSTVAESQRPTTYDVWNQVGMPLIFAVFALIPRSLKNSKDRSNYFFLLSLFGVSVVLAASETRLLMFLSITATIMAGDVLSRLMNYYGSRLFVKWKKGLKFNREAAMGLGLLTVLTTLAILSLFAIPTYSTGYGPVISHVEVYRSMGMSGHNYWLGALLWLRENTDQNAIVISWWDYGYLIQYYADRTTVVDPGNVYEWRNVEVAKFFMSESEEESLKILDKSFGLGGREVYVLVSLEEVPKSHAIARIAGSPTPSFQLTQQGWGIGNFNALLTKLVLGIRWPEYVPSLAHFEKVYCDLQYIAIYRIIW